MVKIDGIVFEGITGSGKTSTIKILNDRLQEFGSVKINHYILSEDISVGKNKEIAFNSINKNVSNTFPDSSYLKEFCNIQSMNISKDFDCFERKTLNNTLLLQDRYAYSQIWLNDYFGFSILNNNIFKSMYDFKLKVYLYCDELDIFNRLNARPESKSRLHKYFLENFDCYLEFEKFCRNQVSSEHGWLLINTSKLSECEVSDLIYDYYIKEFTK